jgi:hypothetical protein
MLFDRTSVTAGSRLVTKLGVAGALALGLAAAAGSAPAEAAVPTAAVTVTVTPDTGLQDGQTVTVAATGLTPSSVQNLGECTLTAQQQPACVSLGTTTSQADGSASAPVTVHKTFTGYVGSTSYGTVDCSAVQCFIGISDSGPSGVGGGLYIYFQ